MSMVIDLKDTEESEISGTSPKITLRLYPDLERAILAWMRRQPGHELTMQEAIRQLLVEALARK